MRVLFLGAEVRSEGRREAENPAFVAHIQFMEDPDLHGDAFVWLEVAYLHGEDLLLVVVELVGRVPSCHRIFILLRCFFFGHELGSELLLLSLNEELGDSHTWVDWEREGSFQ